MTPLVCPRCWTVAIVDAPPKLGEPPHTCPCLDRPPITKPIALVRLRLPDDYELRKKNEPAQPAQ